MMRWFKLFNEASLDPKWLAIADLAGSSPAIASATFFRMLGFANEQPERGSIAGFERELPVLASFYRVTIDELRRVWAAIAELGMLAGDRIANWSKRQDEEPRAPAIRRKSPAAIRQERRRAKRRAASAEPELPGVTPVTPRRDSSVTPGVTCHAGVTPPEAEIASSDQSLEADVTPSAPDLDSDRDEEREVLPSGASRARDGTAVVVDLSERRRSEADGRRLCSIPPDWWPGIDGCRFAVNRGYDERWIGEQAELFRDHYLSRGEERADWQAQWRSWVQRAGGFAGGAGGRGRGGGRSTAPQSGESVVAAVHYANTHLGLGGR
jgi:hypothetical protein